MKYSITFTNSTFEKTEYANTFEDAFKIAKNSDYYPIEISDYSEMIVIIKSGTKEYVFNYNELT